MSIKSYAYIASGIEIGTLVDQEVDDLDVVVK
jgi:hypothetical protein